MKYIFITVYSIIFLACSGPRVLKTEFAEGTDISQYKTFDFYKLEASGDTMSRQFRDRSDNLQQAIAAELQAKGYALSSQDPDLLVNIGIVVKDKVQTRQTDFRTDAPLYVGQRRYSWRSEEVVVGSYRMGTATVDLVDAAQNKMIWQGIVEGVIPDKEARAEERLQKGMKELFEDFPAKTR